MSVPNLVADFKTTLALKVAIGATTATLSSVTDEDGDALPNGFYGFTIDRNNSNKEYITCTLTGTALSAISTIDRGTGVATSGFAQTHRKGAEVIISDFVAIKRLQDIFETGYPEAYTPSTDYQLASKKYVDDLALGGSTTVDRVTVVATCGEDVTAGQLLYLKVSDSKWWKTDADTVATVDNVVLGIAQGAGTANAAITGGVLIKGVDPNQSGLTPNSIYYASNTAGGISATSGTNTRIVGIATAADKLYFDPEFNKTYKNYAVDSVGTDSYAITLQSAFGALYAGMEVTFKAGTANTGACTLAVNGLTAKTIKKNVTDDLITGDILVDQVVKVVYDGINFQMVSPSASGIRFGGSGSDGALNVTSGTTTLDMAGATVFTKNYTSINVSAGATLTFSNPASTGTIIILKATLGVTIAGTINASGMGAEGSTNGFGILGTESPKGVDGSGGTATGGAIMTLKGFYTKTSNQLHRKDVFLYTGSGGGRGQNGDAPDTAAGGTGGRGGGGLYIECRGALDFTGTINTSGLAGSAGANGTSSSSGAGGGGGGSAGPILVLYNILTANSGTLTSSGGAGGAGGTGSGGDASGLSAGGSGAGSYTAAGGAGGALQSVGSNAGGAGAGGGGGGGNPNGAGSAGGTGGSTESGLVALNTEF